MSKGKPLQEVLDSMAPGLLENTKSAKDKWKAALASVDPGRKVHNPDGDLGAPPAWCLMKVKDDIQALMKWTAATWLDHAVERNVCLQCRGFYVHLAKISEQLFYTMRQYDADNIGRLYGQKEGE